MNKYTLVALSVAAGFFSGLAWTEWCPGLIILAGLVPFFVIENYLFENRDRYHENSFFIYILPGFLVFCLITLGWVRVATTVGAIFIIMGLTFLMAFTMWLAHRVRITAGDLPGLISMVAFWLTFEYACLNNDILTPWLNLGNGFAKEPEFIQWYEVTGVAGGTLWILVSNLFLAGFIIRLKKHESSLNYLIIWIIIILLPAALSLRRFNNVSTSNATEHEIVIIQPNYDPYTEKFSVPFELQLKRVLGLAAAATTEQTMWIITPETTIDDPVDESNTDTNKYIRMIKDNLTRYPGAAFMIGMVSFKDKEMSPGKQGRSDYHAKPKQIAKDHYNSAFQIDTGPIINIYHKSKLIPGIEMQSPSITGRLITKILPYFGGTKWGYVPQYERKCFEHQASSFKIAPVICYESVYGKFISEYIRNGAQAIFIITNDGWWRYTNGYKQHLWYASMRAIETRRPVARAANTGISCFIDIRGKIIQKTNWWQPAIMRGQLTPETIITPYVKYGDYLFIIASVVSAFMLIAGFIIIPVKRRIKQQGTVLPRQ
jgi:apolipoprotein N-acyltransferase